MINKEKLLTILNDWNFWQKGIAVGKIREKYLGLMEKYFQIGMVVGLVGLRRSGKSTLMLQFAQNLINGKQIPSKNILYVNFEEARFFGEYSLELLNNIWEIYVENLKPEGQPIIFLDEVQNIPGWEKFVNSLFERQAAKIFVSGSNAQILRSELSAVLTGRQLTLAIYPLNFKEFLLFHDIKIQNELEFINNKAAIKRLFLDYLKYGGLPKAVLTSGGEEKMIVLRNYFDDILARDLISRFKIRETEKLKILAKFYFSNIASCISFNKIKRFLNIPLATVERFSGFLTYPYLFYFINKFSFSLKEQAVNPRKVYAADIGLRNAISFNFSEDRGKLLENLVFLALLAKGKEVYYYKTKNNLEVDFLVKEGQKSYSLIQVCSSLMDYNTREREIKALLAARKELKIASSGIILTEDEDDLLEVENEKILVKPVYKWLLDLN